jgi:hypothetical protein
MIIALITPLVLATAPITIQQVEPLKYSHETQSVEATSQVILAQRQMTFGGTQTYDVSGRPWDNDND